RTPFENRAEQRRVIPWIVFEVAILDDDNIAGHLFQPRAYRPTLAHITGVEKDPGVVVENFRFQNLPGAIGREVIDNDDLLGHRNRPYLFEDGRDRPFLVEDGYDHTEQNRVHSRRVRGKGIRG